MVSVMQRREREKKKHAEAGSSYVILPKLVFTINKAGLQLAVILLPGIIGRYHAGQLENSFPSVTTVSLLEFSYKRQMITQRLGYSVGF